MCSQMIAVIDDDALVLSATGSLLRSHGYVVRLFPSAEAFLDTDFSDVDCVLSDHRLPGRSGLDLLLQLRDHTPQFPVILLTAFRIPIIWQRAKEYGALGILEKPCSAEDLLALLEQI